MANGTFIGGAPTQAIQTNFTQIGRESLDRYDRLEAQRQAEQRRQEDLARQQKQRLEDKYGFNEELMTLEGSEFRTLDDATTETIHQLRDRYYDVFKDLEKNPNDLSLKKRLGKITGTINNIKSAYDKMKLIGDDYVKKEAEGKVSGLHEGKWQTILESTDQGNLRVVLDKDDNPHFLFYDKPDENGTSRFSNSMSYKDLIQGSIIEKVDVDQEIDDIVSNFGDNITTESENGFLVTTSELGADNERIASEMIYGYLEDESITADLLHQMTGSSQESNFSQNQKELVHDKMMNRIKSRFGYKEKRSQLSTSSGGSGRKSTTPTYKDISLSTVTQTGEPLVNPSFGYEFRIPNSIQIEAANKDRRIDTLYLDDQGNVRMSGQDKVKTKIPVDNKGEALSEEEMQTMNIFLEQEGDKVTAYKYETVDGSKLSDSDVNKMAIQLDLSNSTALRKHLQGLLPEGGQPAVQSNTKPSAY